MVAFGKTGVVVSEKKRKVFTGEIKAKVALEAIRGVKTVNEIAQDFGVHPTQVGQWKKELQGQAAGLFEVKRYIERCFFGGTWTDAGAGSLPLS